MTRLSEVKASVRPSRPPVWPLARDHPLRDYLISILSEDRCGLGTDIDGTISATAPTVNAAVLLSGMRELLREASQAFGLVVTVSGRGVEDQRRMIGVPGVWHVGHHGYEWEELDSKTGQRRVVLLPEAAPFLEDVSHALDEIEAELAPLLPGLWMERKGITGGVHWRLAADHDVAEQIAVPIVTRIARLHGLRTRASKLAVELFPPVETNKGSGLLRVIEMHQLSSVIYLGDDASDTDVFDMLRGRRNGGRSDGLAVGVLHASAPGVVRQKADLLLRETAEVPAFFRWLLDMRSALRSGSRQSDLSESDLLE